MAFIYLVAHFLLENGSIGWVVVAAGQQGGQQNGLQGFVWEVAKRQTTELLKHRRHVARLENHLNKTTRVSSIKLIKIQPHRRICLAILLSFLSLDFIERLVAFSVRADVSLWRRTPTWLSFVGSLSLLTWLSWWPVAKNPMHNIVRLRRWATGDGALTPYQRRKLAMWRNSSDTPSAPKIAFPRERREKKQSDYNWTGIAKIEKSPHYLESGQVEKRQTVDQLKCRDREANRVISQLGRTANRRWRSALMEEKTIKSVDYSGQFGDLKRFHQLSRIRRLGRRRLALLRLGLFANVQQINHRR